jgi:hypothetical protein
MHQCITAFPKPLCESVYNPASQLWGNNMLPYGQNMAAEPSCVSPVSVTNVLAPSMEPICQYSVFLHPCYLAAFVMSLAMLSQVPSISSKAQVYLTVFVCFLYTCNHMVHCSFFRLPCFVGRLFKM